ncbi:glutaredoxin family protein [Cryobacterium sp. SO2]|uniref:glutaredoxin family protein n=1 Tax=Cryobacterium sp. SO2 TaxID=1897060 RepID=UPI00223CDEEC|nr:glutaredoxin family protein [Cryobacterium sp. SO2]WEO77700.1 glutaredoxin family protein [Cryobacterium sp. SO2]
MSTAHLTLIGKPGCHLCDDARTVVTTVLTDLAAEPGAPQVVLEEKSILDDPELHELYVEDIPVLLINGLVHNYWRIDPVRLHTALLEVR